MPASRRTRYQSHGWGLVREAGAGRSPPRPMMAVGPAAACQYIQGAVPKGWAPEFRRRPSIPGKSYCATHAARCYKLSKDMTDKGKRDGVPVPLHKRRKRRSTRINAYGAG